MSAFKLLHPPNHHHHQEEVDPFGRDAKMHLPVLTCGEVFHHLNINRVENKKNQSTYRVLLLWCESQRFSVCGLQWSLWMLQSAAHGEGCAPSADRSRHISIQLSSDCRESSSRNHPNSFKRSYLKKTEREYIYFWGERVRSVPRRHDRSLRSSSSLFFRSRTRQPAQHTIMWLLESRLRTGLGGLIQIRPGEANSWLKRLLLSAPNTHWAQLSPPSDTAVVQYADLCNCATWKNSRRSSCSTQSSLTRLNSF